MECNKDEAVRAKNIAENKMINNDFEGGSKFARKAQKLFPELENISQMLAVCDVHCSAKRKINGAAMDLYGILQIESSADAATIKKQYRKLALVLHPDNNRCPGAEAAFKLVGEADMILSDIGKRSLHDYMCRDISKSTILKQQSSQGFQSSQFGAQNNSSNGHQQSQSDSNVRPSFKCSNCGKYSTAVNIGVSKSTQTPHQQEGVAKQEKAKADPQKAKPTFSRSAYQPQCTKSGDANFGLSMRGKTVVNANRKTKGGKEGDANKGAGGNPSGCLSDFNGKNVECSKNSRKRSHVSNTISEDTLADFSPEKRSRRRKSSSDVKDKPEEQKEIPADAELNEEDDKSDSDSEDDSEPVYLDVPDLEFCNFDKDKEEHCFAVDQIWAIYDTVDSMPRFYAQIRKVYSPGFRLRITWLEADPEDLLERNWADAGLPTACGKFKRGDSEKTEERLMFSHRMAFRKGSKSFSFVIYPIKGEIWALFKDWDITEWSSDPENHMKHTFQIVEILSDFDKENGVLVAFMVKVEGFVSLFQKTSQAHLAEHRISSSDLFRFSHRIPSLKLTGNERAGVPVGSFELDAASLPDDLDQFYFSDNMNKLKPENVPAQMRSRRRKSSSDVKDKPEEQKEIHADTELNEEDDKSGSDSEDDSEPVYVDVPDLEFSNFDKDKEEHCFAVDQIWAIYDTVDGMPRFYALIRKVYSSGFRLRITWLEADPEDLLERNWADAGLPTACGKFKRGDSEKTEERLMFSHRMAFRKGSKSFSFVIYPKKGEIWALFKDWDITEWSSDPENHMKHTFQIVEILSDFDKESGVLVAYMVKVEGFLSLFQKTSQAHLAEHRISSSDLFRFSHRIPSLKLTGNERAGVPVGSFELDTASLPDDLDQFYFSNNMKKVKPENVPAQMSASFPQSPEKNVSKIAMSSEVNNLSSKDDDDVKISCTKFTNSDQHSSPSDGKESKIIIHNFNLDKQLWFFEEGQIWALGKSKNVNLRRYAQIKKVEPAPLRLHVELLELCNDAIRQYSCGIYKKASAEARQIFQHDSFLYLVKAEVNGRNRFNIYPRKKEIWILYEENTECTFADVDAGNCDIVEVVENNGDVIKVLTLTHVVGYKSVFKALGRAVEIPFDESHRFLCQVPAFLLTDEQDGLLRGFWELDLSEFPGLVP